MRLEEMIKEQITVWGLGYTSLFPWNLKEQNKAQIQALRTDEQLNQQPQEYEYEYYHLCITKNLEVYDEEANEPALSNLRIWWADAKEDVQD